LIGSAHSVPFWNSESPLPQRMMRVARLPGCGSGSGSLPICFMATQPVGISVSDEPVGSVRSKATALSASPLRSSVFPTFFRPRLSVTTCPTLPEPVPPTAARSASAAPSALALTNMPLSCR
jgi:hypothetical protein